MRCILEPVAFVVRERRMNKVSAVGCESYDLDVVCGAMGAVLDQLGYVLPRGQTVLIKPNVMSQNRPQQHTVTHYSVVAALCQLLADNGCRVQIGDSEAFFERGMTCLTSTCRAPCWTPTW